ncbi:MAG TPA: polysaccharide biosynthesis/export family protein [Candidatus Saccharimonadaceae bacterium]|jgi:polysaccharide export outer membrane protein|nr:polysaccharide biosynthesis/export family protein [Candidatus Saccharimonadaceae bacterium]
MKRLRGWRIGIVALGVVLATLGARAARAEDYVIGPEDVLAISVWGHPELERTVAVAADGNITVAPIGDLKAEGMTAKQLADRLGDRLSAYLRVTAQVTVTVRDYLSHSVFVSGAVARPGRFGFEHIPNLVDVISAAGGAAPGADLGHVQVVHRDGEVRHTVNADVASALRDGIVANLPALKPGDTVIVPAGAAGGVVSPSDGVGVLGEVSKPGVYAATGGQDLWAILASAGGLTPRGDLSNVRVVTRQGAGQAVISVNLQDALKRGTRAPFVIQPGDIVYVAPTGASALGRSFNGFTQALTLGRDLLNIAVLADVLKRGGN